jgi:hypothetical protein
MDLIQELLTHRDELIFALVLSQQCVLTESYLAMRVKVTDDQRRKIRPMAFSKEQISWTRSWIERHDIGR